MKLYLTTQRGGGRSWSTGRVTHYVLKRVGRARGWWQGGGHGKGGSHQKRRLEVLTAPDKLIMKVMDAR